MSVITKNLREIRQQIADAALQCGRDPSSIQLVAVSKKFPASAIQEAMQAGQRCFGENYLQEAAHKKNELGPMCDSASFHCIGHLQSNKAKLATQVFQVIESVDRFKLALAIDKELKSQGRKMDILVQINIGHEPQKSGVLPQDAERFLQELHSLSHLRVRGLMAIPPYSDDPEHSRPFFKALRGLAAENQQLGSFYDNTRVQLSMGMSHDYRVAIEEGATILRIGTAIFGTRAPQIIHS